MALKLKKTVAQMLAEADADVYRREFDRAVAKRLPTFTLELENR